MLNLTIAIGKFHPAVTNALLALVPEGKVSAADVVEYILQRAHECAMEGHKAAETKVRASEKENKKSNSWKVNLSGSVKGINLPDSPLGLLVRLNTYLEGSREYYLRVETVSLPASVEKYVEDVLMTLEKALAEAEKATAKA